MAVHLDTDAVLYNAFFTNPNLDFKENFSISFDNLRRFCDKLYDAVYNAGHKYIIIHGYAKDIDYFCDNDEKFVKGIDKIFCMKQITHEEIESINRHYPKDIQLILEHCDVFWSK